MRIKTALVAALVCCMAAVAQDAPWSQRMIKSQASAWTGAVGWDYVNGLVSKAVLCYAEQYAGERYATQACNLAKAFVNASVDQNGNFYYFRTGSLDNIAPGKVLLGLYRMEEAKTPGAGARYKAAADYLYNYLRYQYPRIDELTARGCFIHKERYPYQMWLDGMYMGPAFYAEYLATFAPDDADGWTDVANQFLTIHNYTYDEDYHLNYHGWSARPDDASSFWANAASPYQGCSSEFWGRGMGWYFAALVDVLELMPTDHPEYRWMLEIYREVADGLVEWQDASTGVWYQLLRYDDSFVSRGGRANYPEASASSMFAYGLLKGLRLGLLPEDTFRQPATRAYRGVLETFIDESADGTVGIHGICRSAGLGPASDPSRDGTADYYLDGNDVTVVSNEGKGIGAFILASLEYELWQSAALPAVGIDSDDTDADIYNLQGVRMPGTDLPAGIYISAGRKIIRR